MKDLGYMLMELLWGCLTLTWKGVALAGRVLGMVVVPLASLAVRRLTKARAPRPIRLETASLQVDVSALPQEPVRDTGPATVIHNSNEFDAADRIVSLRLDPPVGVIHLRVYFSAGVVKRDLVISEPCLTALMKGRRHNFPDVPYYSVGGLEVIKDDTVALAEKLINELANQGAAVGQQRKAEAERRRTEAPPTPEPVRQATRQEPAPPVTSPAHAEPAAPPPKAEPKGVPLNSKVVAPWAATGFTYVGKLVKAGTEVQRPKGRNAYEVFEATLALDNGAELSLRGAELARELTANGCQVGNRIAITPMGKVPVSLANGEEGSKNLYRVQRMGASGKG